MRQAPEQTSFNGGEWGKRMKGRRDTDEYRLSCQNMENWVPKSQGSMVRRGGSELADPLDPPPTPPADPS